MNLYQKISAITDSLGIIQKDASAPKEMGGFRFLSHGMVLGHLRSELTKHNVVIIPNGEELLRVDNYTTGSGKVGRIVTVKHKFVVVDGDNPEDRFEAYWLGEGQDTSDKAIQKAGTSAEKYFLMKLFKVGDKDDPDADKQDGAVDPNKTQSISATMSQKDGAVVVVRPEPAAPVVVTTKDPVPTSLDQDDPELRKKQLQALIWFGEQLPPAKGWFPGKITALVLAWDNKAKQGKLTDAEKEAPSGVKYVFGKIAEAHHENCGAECPHINAANLAVILGGIIVDPARS